MSQDLPANDEGAREQAADPHFNVALEASAGTGKTRVLVDRYLRLLEEGTQPRHILAITFTRKASGEMKSRIIEELRKRGPLWKELRERLFDIHIATIDAFCLGLLREFPLEAGLDPDVELLDEVDASRLMAEAIDEVLAEAARPGGADLGFLFSCFGDAGLRRGLRDFLRSRLVKEELLHRFVAESIPRSLRLEESLRRAATGLRDILAGAQGLDAVRASGPPSSLLSWQAWTYAMARAVDPHHASAIDIEKAASYFLTQTGEPRKRLHPAFKKSDFPNPKQHEEHCDLVLARAPEVAEVYRRWMDDRDRYAVRELWKLYRRAARRFTELKKIRGHLDFTDVLLHAVRLLEQRGEFSQSRFRLEARYHHLLIDELQDTNQVQWRLVMALVGSWGEGAGLVQDAILAEQAAGHGGGRLREPTLFVVGDRKQSIYGWRDARVEVMESAARHILRLRPGGGSRLTIRRSFRAGGELLDFLNDVFSEVPQVREELGWAFRYREEDHFPPSQTDGAQVPVGLAVATELPEVAAAVADEVVRLLRKESFRPKDVAVLFRSRTHYRIYEEALAERGVPTYVYRGLGFYDSPEVRDIQALVRFLAEPGSELRAAEFLRSRLVGLSDTGLVELVRTERTRRLEGPLSQLLRRGMGESDLPHTLSPQDRAAAIQTGALVPRWLRQVDRMPPADLLEQILAEADYAAWFADRKHGLQGWENLKKILELIRRAQNRGYLTLSRLADYLDSASTGEESLAVLEAVDAVSLMTIHAAKGLEFDAVFVVNMDQKTRSDTSLPRIKELPDGRAEIHALRRPEWEGPDRAEEEEKRLLYVALTRARKKLILCATRLEGAEGTLTSLRLLPRGLQELMRAALTSREQELVWKSRKAQHRLKILRPAAEPQHYRVTEMVSPRRQALDPLPAASRSRTTVGERAREQAGETWSSWSFDPVDLAIGRVVHRLFEYAAAVDEQLVRAAEALLPELLERTLSERQDTARRAAHFYRRLRQQRGLESLLKSGEVHREVPFALYLSDQIIRGAIDSLVLLPRRVVVIDYKTGGSRPEHQLQMELYVEAARNMFPDRAVEGLVFYPQGDPVQVRPAPNGVGTSSQLKLF